MIQLSKRETKLMVAIHGWSGIVLGLALYAVVITGMAAVFHKEIGRWSSGTRVTPSSFAQPLNSALGRVEATTPTLMRENIELRPMSVNHLGVYFHQTKDAKGRRTDQGILYELDEDRRTVATRRGNGRELFGPGDADALERFLIDTHVRLHLPNPWGLLLTGVLGLAMLVAAISGMFIHRHLFKDVFTLRRNAAPVLALRDRHSVAGTWSLPFAFALAFTGSFFSFAGTVGLPAMVVVAFAGDQQKMIEALVGKPAMIDARPAASKDLDRVLADATARAGSPPTNVSISRWGYVNATITTTHGPRSGSLEPVFLVYNGSSGVFQREKPLLGSQPSLGNAVLNVMGPIHFGDFAGLASKGVWFGLGFAMCYVTLTGMQLWLRRRQERSPPLFRLDRVVTAVGLGLPLALQGAAIGYFVGAPHVQALWWTPVGFLIGAGAALVVACFKDGPSLSLSLRLANGVVMVGLPILRLVTGGPNWIEAIAARQPMILTIDIALALAGTAFLATAWNGRRSALLVRRR